MNMCSKVPADKALNNVVFMCKKHYIEVIMEELMDVTCSKSSYQYVTDNPISIILKYIKYMKEINLVVTSKMEELPCLYWLPKLHKTHFGSRFLLPQVDAQQNLYLAYLLHVSILLLCILRNIVTVYI